MVSSQLSVFSPLRNNEETVLFIRAHLQVKILKYCVRLCIVISIVFFLFFSFWLVGAVGVIGILYSCRVTVRKIKIEKALKNNI